MLMYDQLSQNDQARSEEAHSNSVLLTGFRSLRAESSSTSKIRIHFALHRLDCAVVYGSPSADYDTQLSQR